MSRHLKMAVSTERRQKLDTSLRALSSCSEEWVSENSPPPQPSHHSPGQTERLPLSEGLWPKDTPVRGHKNRCLVITGGRVLY